MTLANIRALAPTTQTRLVYASDKRHYYVIPGGTSGVEAVAMGSQQESQLRELVMSDPDINVWLEGLYGSGLGTSLPVNTAVPVAYGSPYLGQTIQTTNGAFSGIPTPVYTYQWQLNGANVVGQTTNQLEVSAVSPAHGDTLRCQVTATNTRGVANMFSNALTAVRVPVNTAAPALSGSPVAAGSLAATTGTWTAAVSYSYQWQKNTVNLFGQTLSSLAISATGAVNGDSLRCRVTATNAAGSTTSNTTPLLASLVPVNSFAPAISGTPQAGQALTTSNGIWAGSPTFAYQWYRNAAAISGQTTSSYTVGALTAGDTIHCRVTATNSAGSVFADSNLLTFAVAAPSFTFVTQPVIEIV